MIEFRRVNKIYDEAVETHALQDFSLTIEDGEFVFIIGDSGCFWERSALLPEWSWWTASTSGS